MTWRPSLPLDRSALPGAPILTLAVATPAAAWAWETASGDTSLRALAVLVPLGVALLSWARQLTAPKPVPVRVRARRRLR
jgi:hypothetical protein